MRQPRKIFAAIDFSPASDEALRDAHERAQSSDGRLAVCHIVPNELRSNVLFPHISRIAALKFPLEMSKIADAAAARVTEVTGRAVGDFELIVDDGAPQALILNNAEDWKADLVVVGSHGQTSAADALLGSVTESPPKCRLLPAQPELRSSKLQQIRRRISLSSVRSDARDFAGLCWEVWPKPWRRARRARSSLCDSNRTVKGGVYVLPSMPI